MTPLEIALAFLYLFPGMATYFTLQREPRFVRFFYGIAWPLLWLVAICSRLARWILL